MLLEVEQEEHLSSCVALLLVEELVLEKVLGQVPQKEVED